MLVTPTWVVVLVEIIRKSMNRKRLQLEKKKEQLEREIVLKPLDKKIKMRLWCIKEKNKRLKEQENIIVDTIKKMVNIIS